MTGGTGTRARLADRPAAGKTGTSQDNADAWFVGYTPQLVTAVWMGSPAARDVDAAASASSAAVQGGTFPALIWHQIMGEALDGVPAEDFVEPPPPVRRAAVRLYLPGDECGGRYTVRTDVPEGEDPDEFSPVKPPPGGGLPNVPVNGGYAVGRCGSTTPPPVPRELDHDHRGPAGEHDDHGGGHHLVQPDHRAGVAHHRAAGPRHDGASPPSAQSGPTTAPLATVAPADHPVEPGERPVAEWSDLLALQHLDTAADQLRHRRGHLPERAALDAAEATVADVERRSAAVAEQLGELRRQQKRQLEHEIADLRGKRGRGRPAAVAGHRAPRAAGAGHRARQPAGAPQRRSRTEVLELMEHDRAAQPSSSSELATARAEGDEQAVAAGLALAEAEAAVRGETSPAADGERATARATIPEALLAEYERLRPRLGGVAVAEMVNGHCAGATCSARQRAGAASATWPGRRPGDLRGVRSPPGPAADHGVPVVRGWLASSSSGRSSVIPPSTTGW